MLDKKYSIEKSHCGGKGGQNMNRMEAGVRIIHIATEIVAQSIEERSQFLNKQRAMEKLADMKNEKEAEQTNAAWREHTRIVRGTPVRTYEGERFVLRK